MSENNITIHGFESITKNLHVAKIEASEEELSSLFLETLKNNKTDSIDAEIFAKTISDTYEIEDNSLIAEILNEISDNDVENSKLTIFDFQIQEEYDKQSKQIYEATAGQVGTDEQSFYEVLNNEDLTGNDWANIIQSYENLYGRNLIDDIDADFSGISESGFRNEIMNKISSKLLESLDDTNVLNVICKELHSALSPITLMNNKEVMDTNKADDFIVNLLNTSDDKLASILKNYSFATGFDLISEISSNSNIKKADKDLILQRLNSASTNIINNISTTTELNLDHYDLEDKNKAYSINLLIQGLNNSLSDFKNQNNQDGAISGNFNLMKSLTGLGISSEDIAATLSEQENIIRELTNALNGKSDKYSTFEEAYRKLTGVEYNEENIIKFKENSNNYGIAYNALQSAQTFENSIQKAKSMEDLIDLYTNYYGDEKSGINALNEYLSETYKNGNFDVTQTRVSNVEVVKNPETNENEIKVTYTYRDLSYDEYGNEIWQDATREDVINPKDAQNYIYYSDNAGCTLPEKNKYITEAQAKIEECFGASIETLQQNYYTSKQNALGGADKLEERINQYCQSQKGFIDKLASIAQIGGLITIATGAAVSFVNPPLGIGIMSAGKYTALGGMFGDNILEGIDGLSSRDGLTKEDVKNLVKETAQEIGFLALGSGINNIAEIAQTGSLEALKALGLTEKSATVLSWLVEGGVDMSLSVLSDLVITGDLNLENNSMQVLMGILTGVASAKTNSYKANVQEEQLLKLQSGELELEEVETNLKGAGFSEKEISAFENRYKSGELFNKLFNIPNGNSKIDYSNIVTTRETFINFPKGTKLEPNIETKVAAGTVVEIGSTKLNLDDLNLTPGKTITIGRSADISIGNDGSISRQHLQVTATESGYIIKDLNSTNGTKIAFSPLVLRHGDGNITIHKNISSDTYKNLFDSCYSNSRQQANGDCYLLSSINALYENPYGRNAILNCFQEMPDGSLKVKLPNGKYTFDMNSIMREVQSRPDQYSATNKGLQALEYVFGIERFDKLPTSVKKELLLNNQDAVSYRSGGLTKEVMQMFGLDTTETNISSMVRYLSNPNNWQNKNSVFTIATKRTPSGGGDNTYWYRNLDLAGNHMYLAQPRIVNGKVVVDIKNPWHSNQISCTLSLDDIVKLGCFDYFSITQVK